MEYCPSQLPKIRRKRIEQLQPPMQKQPQQHQAHVMPLSWTCEMESRLIDLVRAQPDLWNVESSFYTKKSVKKHIYCQIARDLQAAFPDIEGITAEALRAKFSILRSSFRREMVKIKSVKSGSGVVYTPKWKQFDSLLFLIDSVSSESSSKLDNRTMSVDGNQKQVKIKGSLVTPVNAAVASAKHTTSVSSTRESDASVRKQRLLEKVEKCLGEEDEYDNFGKVVAEKLRKMSETQSLFAEKQIMEILYNGAMNTISTRSGVSNGNECNNSISESSSSTLSHT